MKNQAEEFAKAFTERGYTVIIKYPKPMRELKFRVWDKKNITMSQVGILLIGHGATGYSYPEKGEEAQVGTEDADRIVMQFVGLHDKNGTPIYEGDILATPQYEEKYAEVAWVGNHFGMGYSMLHDGSPVDMEDDWSEFEIVGNIYEHPHLIKK